jgi:hypothetical protein
MASTHFGSNCPSKVKVTRIGTTTLVRMWIELSLIHSIVRRNGYIKWNL